VAEDVRVDVHNSITGQWYGMVIYVVVKLYSFMEIYPDVSVGVTSFQFQQTLLYFKYIYVVQVVKVLHCTFVLLIS